jgi:hypothetical protein
MTPENLFSIVNPIAVVGWILLIALPRQRWAATIAAWAIPGLLAIAYVAVVFTHIVGSPGGFSSLPAVATLFGNPCCSSAGGFTTWRSICSSGTGRRVMRASGAYRTSRSSLVCF